MRFPLTVLAIACAFGACADTSSVVQSQAANIVTTCAGVLAGTHENIEVPVGSSCTLQGVTVNGNVVAREDARLVLNGSTIKGNVQGEKAAAVHVSGGVVGGNIQIQAGSSPGELGVSITNGTRLTDGSIQVTQMRTGRILIADAILEKGNLQVEDNDVSGEVEILRNRVAQNLEFRKHFSAASKVVSDNTVGQKLECSENSAPFTATGNSAPDNACTS